MAVTLICPLCDSANSPSAEHCSCGYSFMAGRGLCVSRMWKGIGWAFLGFVLLLVADLDLVDRIDLPISSETLTIGALAAVLGGVWLFASGLSRLMRKQGGYR